MKCLMNLLAVLILTLGLASAQTSTPSSVPAATVTPAAAVPPQNFAGAGAAYNPVAPSNRTTGWATYGHLLDAKSETYFFTTEEAIAVKNPSLALQTSVRVGFGTLMKTFGPVKLYGIGDGGGATTGTTSGGAGSLGTFALIKLGKHDYYFGAGYRVIVTSNTSTSTNKVWEAGFFKSWN
jgi:hypothetical protein